MSFQEIVDIVKSYPKLQKLLKTEKVPEWEVDKIVKEMAADYMPSTIKRLESLFDSTFVKLYSGFSIDTDVDVLQLQKENNLILVPNHQSYADFLGIGYAFYKEIPIPIHIAAGKNLNVFPVGNYFRRSGAFFIRRSFKGDKLYKYTLEAYLYYLFIKSYPVKFYFEGGRSRTGKLMPPKYGLFQMILEAHSKIENPKPLMFLPISISHESLPDYKSHKNELMGEGKKQESSSQLYKLFKLWNAKFGKIHLKIGKPVRVNTCDDDKKRLQNLAFDCFRAVGRGVMLSPTALLSMVLLDQVLGALTLEKLKRRCYEILEYCEYFDIPITVGLKNKESREKIIFEALGLLIYQKKVVKNLHPTLGKEFYFVNKEERSELLYLKNTILHHFLIPLFVGTVWVKMNRGEITSIEQMRIEFLEQRDLLKYEFYLPETEVMFDQVRRLISKLLNYENFRIQEAFALSKKDFHLIGKKVGVYASSFAYIYEGYYLACLVFQMFPEKEMQLNEFVEKAKEVFEIESQYGQLIRRQESFSVPLIKNALLYLEQIGAIENKDQVYRCLSGEKSVKLIERFINQLTNFLSLQSHF